MSQDKTKASKEEAHRLADLITEGRSALPITKFAQMNKFRDVLKKQRKAGASVRVITAALSKLGVTVSEETVRVWFQRNKTVKPSNRTKAARPVKMEIPTEGAVLARKTGTTTSAGVSRPRIARNDI